MLNLLTIKDHFLNLGIYPTRPSGKEPVVSVWKGKTRQVIGRTLRPSHSRTTIQILSASFALWRAVMPQLCLTKLMVNESKAKTHCPQRHRAVLCSSFKAEELPSLDKTALLQRAR